jgi:hypothetical protein
MLAPELTLEVELAGATGHLGGGLDRVAGPCHETWMA